MSKALDNTGFFRLAKRAFEESKCRVRMGAVLVSKGRPVSFGWNKDKTHPKFANPLLTLRTSIHAEMDCIRGFEKEELASPCIYVYREDANGNIAKSRPCDECMLRLKELGIKYIIYTITEYPFWEREELDD